MFELRHLGSLLSTTKKGKGLFRILHPGEGKVVFIALLLWSQSSSIQGSCLERVNRHPSVVSFQRKQNRYRYSAFLLVYECYETQHNQPATTKSDMTNLQSEYIAEEQRVKRFCCMLETIEAGVKFVSRLT